MEKYKCRTAMLMLMAAVLLLMTPAVALETSENEFSIPEEIISNSVITKESDALITVVTKSAPAEAPIAFAERSYGSTVYSSNVDVVALVISEPTETDKVYQALLTAADEGSSYKTKSNYVAGLKIHSTVYYTIREADGHEWYHLVAVEGGNDKSNSNSNVIGSGFVIASQSVTYGVQGANLEGQSTSGKRETKNLKTSDDCFYIEVDDSWPTIGDYFGVLGAYYSVDIVNRRDSSHILLELSNNPIDSISFPGV